MAKYYRESVPEVLIIGPDVQEVSALLISLSKEGYQSFMANHPLQAVERLMTANVGAAVVLPKMDDRDWLDSIAIINGLRPRLPVIVIAETTTLEAERSLRRGRVFYHLLKPFDMAEMKAVLRDASITGAVQ